MRFTKTRATLVQGNKQLYTKSRILIEREDQLGIARPIIAITHRDPRIVDFLAKSLTAFLNVLQSTDKFKEVFNERK